MAKAAEFYTVKESFIGSLRGHEVEYQKGEVVAANDPAVKKMARHFEPIVVKGGQSRGDVEQATAAPGEKRRLPLRRRPAAKAKVKAVEAPAPEPEPAPEPAPEPEGKAMTNDAMKGRV